MNNYKNAIGHKALSLRTRTWTLTLALAIALILYFAVQVVARDSINWIDFLFLLAIIMLSHSIYFPDGELFGQTGEVFTNNRTTYNGKASRINRLMIIGKLRNYCEIEYEERKAKYISNECGAIGITLDELELLKQKTKKEIKALEVWEVFEQDKEHSKLIIFSKQNNRRLRKLLFRPIPVEKNNAETILSAVDNDMNKAIKDGSVTFKKKAFLRKFLMATLVGGLLAYIGYTFRDGFGFEQIVQIFIYLTSMFSTSVLAFNSGETCSKIHKNLFYVELANYIDGFFEWAGVLPEADEEVFEVDKTIQIQEPVLENKPE